MALDVKTRRFRAKQVGRLMQSYRLEREGRGRGGRLSQSSLLSMMGKIKEEYADYSHSTVARWESGQILPTEERLETFGAALDLPRAEIDGLIALAGLGAESAAVEMGKALAASHDGTAPASVGPVGGSANDGKSDRQVPSYSGAVLRYCLTRFTLPALVIAGAGCGLYFMRLSAPWMFVIYVSSIVVMVMVQGFMKLRRNNDVRDLLFVSIFFILTAPLFQTPMVGTDVYGIYTIGGFAGTPFVYLVALIVNLLLAAAAGAVFDVLWRWQYSGPRDSRRAYQRAAWVAFPPVALVFVCNLLFAGVATSFALLIVLPVVGGVMMALLVLRDREVTISEWDRRFLLQSAMGITLALTVLGGAVIVVFYLNPVMISPAKHTTLFYSKTIDFNALGYPESDIVARYLVSSTWSSVTTLAYMTIVLGGSLMATIYRLGSGGQVRPDEAPAPAVAPAPAKRRSKRPRVDARYRAGWLAGRRILQPVRTSAGYPPH